MGVMSGFTGSTDVEVSASENHEILIKNSGIPLQKFGFLNYSACHVKINGSDPIYLAAGQGFSTDVNDSPIKSFVIVEANVRYNWVGTYRQASFFRK